MILPTPPERFDIGYMVRLNSALEAADRYNLKRGAQIELSSDTQLVLTSPNGSRFALTVADDGTLSAAAI